MPRKSHQPSPLKSIVVINDENEDSDTEFLTTFKKPDQSFLNPVRRFEPETQDFHYLFQEDDVVEVEDEADWATESPSKGRGAGRDRQTESPEPRVGSLPDLPEGLQEFVDHHVSLGYAEALVWEALASTTMNTANASIVMENLNGGRGIPEDLQGVWTLSDDAALEAKDRPAFMLVMAKHGKTRVEERLRFLEEQREVREGLIDGDL
jgi:hypothetical protein